MKKVGQGLSYTVYDLGNSRVLKKPTKNVYKFLKLFFWSVRYRKNFSLVKKFRPIISSGFESIDFLRNNYDKLNLDIIGNPIFCDSLEYSQEKVFVLKEYFLSHSFEENKIIVDKYFENVLDTWKSGFSDVDFNFAMNSGVSKNDEVILADINGLSFDFDEVLECVKNKVWLDKYSYNYLVDSELKDYFAKKSCEVLTEDSLKKNWKSLK